MSDDRSNICYCVRCEYFAHGLFIIAFQGLHVFIIYMIWNDFLQLINFISYLSVLQYFSIIICYLQVNISKLMNI